MRGALGPLLQPDPKQAACALAATTAWLHFDDTAYAGHISHSTVNVPVAYARAAGLDGEALLLSIIVANECAARVAASATLSEFRGQTAAYTHLAGAVAGRLKAERAPASTWVSAFGLAFSMPPWPLRRAFLGSDGKILSASIPVRTALDVCDMAAAGLRGAADILEHPQGFLAQFAAIPLPATVTDGLGRRWHTETLSFKMRPGGPGIDAAVDCAIALHEVLGGIDVDDVAEVVVRASTYTVAVEQQIAKFMDGADSPVSALTFSVGYTVATALLTGNLAPLDFARPLLARQERWALAAKIKLEHDPEMTRRFGLAAIPLGEALREAGPVLAGKWLQAAGVADVDDMLQAMSPPSETFELRREGHARARDAAPDRRAGRGARLRHPPGRRGTRHPRPPLEAVRSKFQSTGATPTWRMASRRSRWPRRPPSAACSRPRSTWLRQRPRVRAPTRRARVRPRAR